MFSVLFAPHPEDGGKIDWVIVILIGAVALMLCVCGWTVYENVLRTCNNPQFDHIEHVVESTQFIYIGKTLMPIASPAHDLHIYRCSDGHEKIQ